VGCARYSDLVDQRGYSNRTGQNLRHGSDVSDSDTAAPPPDDDDLPAYSPDLLEIVEKGGKPPGGEERDR
jgi:hypothetical protein